MTRFSLRFLYSSIVFLVGFGLSACSTGLNKPVAASEQEVAVPAKWQQANSLNLPSDASLLYQAQALLAYFDEPELNQAFELLEKNNFELKRQALRLKQAAAQAGVDASALWPSLNLNLAQQEQGLESLPSTRLAELGLQISWELDIWQKLKRQKQAAALDVQAELQTYEALRFSLAAQLAQVWFQQQAAYYQWGLAHDYQRKLEALLRLVESRYQRGISSLLELKQAQSNLAGAKADAFNRHALYLDQHLALAKLLYLQPAPPLKALPTLDDGNIEQLLAEFAKQLPSSVPLDSPGELIQRRPDLQALAYRLDAQVARFASQQKSRLPSLSLSANLALQEESLGSLISDGNLFRRLRANLLAPLFDAKRLRRLAEQAFVRYEQAALDYVQAVSDSVLEVEQNLSKNALFEQRLASQLAALNLAKDTSALALRDYKSGFIDLAQLIQEQANYINAQSRYVDLKLQLLQTRSQLLLAIGGGFEPMANGQE